MSYTKKAVRGTILVFVGMVLSAFVSYLTRIVLARNLSSEDFGLFFAVLSFVLFFGIFRSIGMNQAITKFTSEFLARKKPGMIKATFKFCILTQIVTASLFIVVLFLLSNFLADKYFSSPQAVVLLRILSFTLFFFIFDDTMKKFFQGMQKMHYFSLIEFSRNLFIFILIIVFLGTGLSLYSPVLAYVIAPIITAVIFFPVFLANFPIFKIKAKKVTSNLMKKILAFSMPSLAGGIGYLIMGYVDVIILTYFVSLSQVGIYNAVLPTATLFVFFGKSIGAVMMPLSSELWTKKEGSKLSDGLRRLHKYSFIVVFPAVLVLLSFPKLFLGVLFGRTYADGAFALQILLIGTIFFTITQINNSVLSGVGKPKYVFKVIMFTALFNVIANLILIPYFGINGAAFATSFSYIISLAMSNYYASKHVELNIPWFDLAKVLFAGVIFTLAIYYLKKILVLNVFLEAGIVLVVSALVYVAVLFAINLISVKEIKRLMPR